MRLLQNITAFRIIVNIWAVLTICMIGAWFTEEAAWDATFDHLDRLREIRALDREGDLLVQVVDGIIAHYGDEPWDPQVRLQLQDWQDDIQRYAEMFEMPVAASEGD